MTNHIGEELDFLDERQQNAIYDIMNHEAEALEYILDDPESILDEILLMVGGELKVGKLTDKQMEEACGFGHLYQEAKKKRVLKNMNEFDPDSKVTKRAIDEWQLNFHRDYDGLMDELDEYMEAFRKYCEKRDNLEIFNQAKGVIRYHLRFGWTYDIYEECEPLKVSRATTVQRLQRGNKSRLSSKAEGRITTKQKIKDWPKLRKSMLDEGFTEGETQDFHDNTYMASKKKKTKRKQNTTVYYFYMKGCPYCKEFNKTWLKLKKKNKDVKFVKYNKDDKAQLVKKYGIKTYPAIVRVKGSKHKLYPTDDRTMNKLLKFIGR